MGKKAGKTWTWDTATKLDKRFQMTLRGPWDAIQLNTQMLYLKILREKISKHFACCHRYFKTERKK